MLARAALTGTAEAVSREGPRPLTTRFPRGLTWPTEGGRSAGRASAAAGTLVNSGSKPMFRSGRTGAGTTRLPWHRAGVMRSQKPLEKEIR